MGDFISEYAVGRGGWVQTLAFLALCVGDAAVAALWWLTHADRTSRVVALLIGTGALVDVTSAAFETDADGAASTVHGQVHDLAGLVGFLAVLAAMGLTGWAARHETGLRPVRVPSLVAAGLVVVGFFGVALGEQIGYGGLAQRLVLGVTLAWELILVRHALHEDSPVRRGPSRTVTTQ